MSAVDDTLDQLNAQIVFLSDAMKGHIKEAREASSPEVRNKALDDLLTAVNLLPEIIDGCRPIDGGK